MYEGLLNQIPAFIFLTHSRLILPTSLIQPVDSAETMSTPSTLLANLAVNPARSKNALFQQEPPAMRLLTKPIPIAKRQAKVLDLHERLLKFPDIACISVQDGAQVEGVIFTREFLKRMSEPYQRELNERRSAIDVARQDYFSAKAGEKITDVLQALLAHDPRLKTEAIPVFEGEQLVGAASVSELILSISRNQEHLYQQLETLSLRLRDEVQQTAQLQRRLLPSHDLSIAGIQVASLLMTSSEVGGDFYDYLMLNERYLFVAIGDASGHGVPAGMLVAAAKAAIHTLPETILRSPAQTLAHLNRAIRATGRTELLMTVFCMVLDTQEMTLRYANAGHNFPYLLRVQDQSLTMIEDSGGPPLGLDLDVDYPEQQLRLQPHDKILLYSDGLIENTDGNENEYGYELTEQVLHAALRESPQNLLQQIEQSVQQHYERRAHTMEDDVTLLCLGIDGTSVHRQHAQVHLCVADFELKETAVEKTLQAAQLHCARLPRGHIKQSGFPLPSLLTQHFLNAAFRDLPHFPRGASPILLAERPLRAQISLLQSLNLQRVLQANDPIIPILGWQTLLYGHAGEEFIELGHLCETETLSLTHTEEKEIAIATCMAFFEESRPGQIRPDIPQLAALVLDELLENAFIAVPAKLQQNMAKGTQRALSEQETIRLRYGADRHIAAIQVCDHAGTFLVEKFLERLQRNLYGVGIQSNQGGEGFGGAGLFMVWRLADYLHIHVNPDQSTTVTVIFRDEETLDPESDKSFQVTYAQQETEAHG